MRNGINGVVNNRWCEDKEVVKTKVREFFEARFDGTSKPQVRLNNVRFNVTSDEDITSLVGVVSNEEVKNVVWSCGSSKSPDPDGFNFNFIWFWR